LVREEKGNTSQPRKLTVYGSREDIMASVFHIAISWQGFAGGRFLAVYKSFVWCNLRPWTEVFEKPSLDLGIRIAATGLVLRAPMAVAYLHLK